MAMRSVCRLRVVVIIATALSVLGSSSAWSQRARRPNAPGVWKPWKGLTASPGARTTTSATAAQVKAFEGEMLALKAIVERASGVATPVGFSVETWAHLSSFKAPAHAPGHPGPRALPLTGGFTFGALPIFEYVRNGKAAMRPPLEIGPRA